MYPSRAAVDAWFVRRNARDIESVIASNPGRYPRLTWWPRIYRWAAEPKWAMPSWVAYVGEQEMGRYTMLADMRRVGVLSGGHPEREAEDLAEWCPGFPFKGFLPQCRRGSPDELRIIVAYDLYDWLDELHEPAPSIFGEPLSDS